MIFHSQTEKNLKPHTVVVLFSSRGSPGAAIRRSDYTRRRPWSILVPLVPSSGRMRDNTAPDKPTITILYYHTWVPWLLTPPQCFSQYCTFHCDTAEARRELLECLPIKLTNNANRVSQFRTITPLNMQQLSESRAGMRACKNSLAKNKNKQKTLQ